ncbi:MAG: methyl-accepting chemotaxis protein [Lachnospiraceae bacterium]|nr:methyl-accepting chemotaxis protein [Lachnospiraceae bacterium]
MRIITLALLPVFIIATALCVMSASNISSTMQTETEDKLTSSAYALRTMLDAMNEGEYQGVVEGENYSFYKGEEALTSFNEVLDAFTEETGMYATIFFGDTRYLTSVKANGSRPIGTQCAKEVYTTVSKGEEFISLSTSVAGIDCVVAYIPLFQPGTKTVVGMVFTGVPRSLLLDQIGNSIRANVILAVGITGVIAVIAFIVANTIYKALVSTSKVANTLADGDFTKEAAQEGVKRADELGILVRSVNSLKENLHETICGVTSQVSSLSMNATSLRDASSDNAMSIANLSKSIDEIATGATSQAKEVQSAADNISDILGNISSINASVSQTKNTTDTMQQYSKTVQDNFAMLQDDTNQSLDKLEDVAEKMRSVVNAVEDVVRATQEINEIASQTNLLSLNASIEAARAGEAGRGFSVVASEISALSDQSNQAANTIKDIMNTLKSETDGAVAMVSELNTIMQQQDQTSEQSQESLVALLETIHQTEEQVNIVQDGATAVSKLCDDLNGSIQNLSAISEENAAAAQETSNSLQNVSRHTDELQKMADDLQEVAQSLNGITSQFTV